MKYGEHGDRQVVIYATWTFFGNGNGEAEGQGAEASCESWQIDADRDTISVVVVNGKLRADGEIMLA